MAQNTYQLLTLTANTTLTWPSSFTGGPIVQDINNVTTVINNVKIIMPDATLVAAGQNMLFNNISGVSFDIVANDGTTLIYHVTSGLVVNLYLTNSTTTNGTWSVIPAGGGTTSITQFTAQSSDNSITITNGTVTPPTGTINFKLPQSLTNLNALSTTDFLVVTKTAPLTFKTVELIQGENILIDNSNGINGEPVIDLNPTLTSLNSITVGDMTLSGEVITSNVTNGNIQINTNGTGSVQINGVDISSNGAITGLTNLVQPKAYCNFTDTITGDTNVIVDYDNVNVQSVSGSNGTYTITFINPMANTDYGVFITLGSTGGILPFISNAYYIVRDTTAVTIIITDASGELVLSAPYGVSVMIMSS